MAAIDDLNTSISNLSDAISAEIAALAAAVAKTAPTDDSAAIEASVAKLNDLTAALKASVTPADPAAPTT